MGPIAEGPIVERGRRRTMPQDQAAIRQRLRARFERLIKDPSAAARAETGASIAHEYASGQLSPPEEAIAVDILARLARDEALQVRWALAENVKTCASLPRPIASLLIHDAEAVALPILQHAAALDDEDLLHVLAQGHEATQIAVANRKNLSETVCDVLAASDRELVVTTLLANHGAEISEQAYRRILSTFQGRTDIQALMIERPLLPVTAVARLLRSLTGDLRDSLIARHATATASAS